MMACLLLGLLGHYLNQCWRQFSEILIEMQTFLFMKMPLKWWLQNGGRFVLVRCVDLSVDIHIFFQTKWSQLYYKEPVNSLSTSDAYLRQ